jgi:endoglucanase
MRQSEILAWVDEALAEGSEAHGVSGREAGLTDWLDRVLGEGAESAGTDALGNRFYRHVSGAGGSVTRRILLAAHADEIGLLVTGIDKNGFLRLLPVGGIDVRTLLYQPVTVYGRRELPGVICCETEAKNGKPVPLTSLAVDIGMTAANAAREVRVGDTVVLRRRFTRLLNNRVSGKALDDRAGIMTAAVCLRLLQEWGADAEVIACATSQEEVGCRGALTAAWQSEPRIAIALDVTHAKSPDTKDVQTQMGKGPVIARGPDFHPAVTTLLESCAKAEHLPYQLEVSAGASGTDARSIRLQGQGIPTALLSIPVRYMHTIVETLSLDDIIQGGQLLASFITELANKGEEWPSCYWND